MTRRTVPESVAGYLDDHDESLVETALSLLEFDTRNPPGHTRESTEYVGDRLASAGAEPTLVASNPEKPNLLARVPGDGPGTLLLLGHVDTVPYDAAEWTRDPLGERDGDRIYGRGASDMKGAVAAMLLAVEAHLATGTTPPVDLVFATVSDEEIAGDAGLPTLLERHDCRADACVIGETTCQRGVHSVTVADRGSIWLTVDAEGVAAHGSRPALGVNAIDRLYAAVDDLRTTLGDYELELDPAVESLVEESVAFYAGQMGEVAARETFERPTVNLGVLEGGTAINTVPDAATARIDVRVTASVDTAEVLSVVESIIDAHDGVEITDVSWSRGTYENVESPVVAATTEVAEGVLDDRVYRRSATGGGDAKQLRNDGIATVEFAVGTDTVHGVDEHTTVDALRANAAIYARLPYAYAAAAEGN